MVMVVTMGVMVVAAEVRTTAMMETVVVMLVLPDVPAVIEPTSPGV
jgi:hypothetical protein